MLATEDYIDALEWAESIGGLDGLIGRADRNFSVIDEFVAETRWIAHLAVDPATRSNTSVCLSIADPEVAALDGDAMEAEAWAYLAIRSCKGLPLSWPGTTGCRQPVTGGVLVRPKSADG